MPIRPGETGSISMLLLWRRPTLVERERPCESFALPDAARLTRLALEECADLDVLARSIRPGDCARWWPRLLLRLLLRLMAREAACA